MLEELTQDPEQTGEFGWFGWSDRRRWRRDWDENSLLGPDGGTLIVVSGSERRMAGRCDLQPSPHRSAGVTGNPGPPLRLSGCCIRRP
jgi:hypothetical protein